MSDSDSKTVSAAGPAFWGATALGVVSLVLLWSAWRTQASVAELRGSLGTIDETAARMEKASLEVRHVGERLERLDERLARVERVADEWEFLVDDVAKLGHRMDDLARALENATGVEVGAVQQPAVLDWTEPGLRDAARRAAESVGIALTDDEVRVPARIILRDGILEYFAVLKGGKEHETLLSLVGSVPEDQRRPADFGVKLNNAIQALGFTPGKPIRFTPAGTRPAQGETVYLFVEWEEDGETVVVRAEDLVWDRVRDAPMPRDCWVYVGSSFVQGDTPDEILFAADLTAEAVATYSAVNTIIDNRAPGAQDDTVFLAASPRLPADVDHVTFTIRRVDKEPTRTFELPDRDGGDPEEEGGGRDD